MKYISEARPLVQGQKVSLVVLVARRRILRNRLHDQGFDLHGIADEQG